LNIELVQSIDENKSKLANTTALIDKNKYEVDSTLQAKQIGQDLTLNDDIRVN
jgi:hypothetical protein